MAGSDCRGIVFDIQRFCVHDGPGIRSLVFMKGCPLRCRWCSNPESQRPEPEIFFDASLCVGCGRCAATCPAGAVMVPSGLAMALTDRDSCVGCGKCVGVCPARARSLKGSRVSVEDVVREIEKDRVFYEASGGGVTLSGGEPLLQREFTSALVGRCREKGLTVAIETSGCARWDELESVVPGVDLFLYDIKHLDRDSHCLGTGRPNDAIISNARRLRETGANVVIRFPLIPGYNDARPDVEAVGRFALDLGIQRVDILPCHQLGLRKYDMLDRVPPAVPAADQGLAESARAWLAALKLDVSVMAA